MITTYPAQIRKGVTAALLLSVCGCVSAKFDPDKHPAHLASFWGGEPSQVPLELKLRPVPSELIDYINKDNIRNGYPERPKAALLTDDFKADFAKAVNALPTHLQNQISKRLYGIFLVNDLGGTAFTDIVFSNDHKVTGTFMLLDSGVLERNANEWAAWKESSPFKPTDDWALSVRLEKDAQNNRSNAIQYILLHEFGHVLGSAGGVHPAWNKTPKTDPPQNYPFSKLSWDVDGKGKFTSLFETSFPERKDVKYYFGDVSKKPALSAAPAFYEKLENTGFTTLYAVTNPYDDFAESFALYVHVIVLKKPWELKILHRGVLAKSYRACWTEKRCKEKMDFLADYLR